MPTAHTNNDSIIVVFYATFFCSRKRHGDLGVDGAIQLITWSREPQHK